MNLIYIIVKFAFKIKQFSKDLKSDQSLKTAVAFSKNSRRFLVFYNVQAFEKIIYIPNDFFFLNKI